MTSRPLVSVVIPTQARPKLLPTAVRSALDCHGYDVEVIVIPNGSDDSWRTSLSAFSNDARVRVSPIPDAHANVARNHGLEVACGKYVRFLDDDDYLLPPSAKQVDMIERAGADMCSGRLLSVDQDGSPLGPVGFSDSRDFVCAAVSISGFTLPAGNLFTRESLSGCRWDIGVHRSQDNAWMIDLAANREWRWVHLDETVGVWRQHPFRRTSSMSALKERHETIVGRLLRLHHHLELQGRSSMDRKAAIAAALWHYAHRGFPYHPAYWYGVARRALEIDPMSRPDDAMYRANPLRRIPPLWAECALLPGRRITRFYRDMRSQLFGTGYQRKL